MVVAIMKGYTIFVIILMLLYTARHFYFTIVRLLGRQRLYYNDILTDRMKSISVLIPMHNEEQVLSNVLDSLLKCEYDRDRLEIIPINDNSTDRTREMLDEYHRKYEFIRPLHRDRPDRGFGTVRYVIFIWLLYRFSVIYMAFFYFMIGPMFDFLYLVMIYAVFVNRMIGVYDSRKGKEVWKWS